jgi:AraC-like DNA-binding protein
MPATDSVAGTTSLFHFSTDALPERDRLATWREEFGRQVARYEFEPLSRTVYGAVMVRTAPGFGFISVDHSPMRVVRTPELLADGDDALVLQVSTTGNHVSHLGREFETDPGDAMLGSNADVGTFRSPSATSKCVLLNLSRRDLRPLLNDFDAALVYPVPANTPALRLLMRYVGIFDEPTLSPELQHLAVTHVYDLAAAMLGARRDTAEIANNRGVRAARLREAKAYVLKNLGSQELSTTTVASHLGVTPRYVHKLFETEDESFTEFVLARRLTRAYRMLTDPRFAVLPIGTVALDAGFGDLSHFNRSFRRRFGCTPSDVRAAVRRA